MQNKIPLKFIYPIPYVYKIVYFQHKLNSKLYY